MTSDGIRVQRRHPRGTSVTPACSVDGAGSPLTAHTGTRALSLEMEDVPHERRAVGTTWQRGGDTVGNLGMERLGPSQLPGPHRAAWGWERGTCHPLQVMVTSTFVSQAVSGLFSLNCACDLVKFVTSLPPFGR